MASRARLVQAQQAVKNAERRALPFLDGAARDEAAVALQRISEALVAAMPKVPLAPGEWRAFTLQDFDLIEKTMHGKVICPLCSAMYWGDDTLAKHLAMPHGICADCGQVITAAGISGHRAARHPDD